MLVCLILRVINDCVFFRMERSDPYKCYQSEVEVARHCRRRDH